MGDIVAELRKWADAPIKSPAISKALREAANEIERLRERLVGDDVVTRVLALNHPDAADAADEIERLRDLVRELRPYMEIDAKAGLSVGPDTQTHSHRDGNSNKCQDCEWYEESVAWMKRIKSGELDV